MNSPGNTPGSAAWIQNIKVYKLFMCPSEDKTIHSFNTSGGPFYTNYTVNAALGYRTVYGTGAFYKNYKGLKTTQLPRPSKTGYCWDNRMNNEGKAPENMAAYELHVRYIADGGSELVAYRHAGQINVLFADGHAASRAKTSTMDIAFKKPTAPHLDGRGTSSWLY